NAPDEDILAAFLAAELPDDVAHRLLAFLDAVHWPLAVRSSSLLEDSQYQPFTGVYETFMLPNDDPDPGVRLGQLLRAVQRVYTPRRSSPSRAPPPTRRRIDSKKKRWRS